MVTPNFLLDTKSTCYVLLSPHSFKPRKNIPVFVSTTHRCADRMRSNKSRHRPQTHWWQFPSVSTWRTVRVVLYESTVIGFSWEQSKFEGKGSKTWSPRCMLQTAGNRLWRTLTLTKNCFDENGYRSNFVLGLVPERSLLLYKHTLFGVMGERV